MRYLLLISADEDRARESMERGEFDSFYEWLDDLEKRGVLRAHVGLHLSETATTVRVRSDQTLLTDGPFIEGREQVGGLAVIECDNLDEALVIAARHPAARVGQVEVRPIRD